MHPGELLYALGLYKTVGGASSQFNVNNDVRDIISEWKSDSEALMAKFDKNKKEEIEFIKKYGALAYALKYFPHLLEDS